MKTRFILILYSLVYLLIFSCNNRIKVKAFIKDVNSILAKKKLNLQGDDHIAILVIPVQGCHSCLQVTLQFLNNNIVDSTFALDNCFVIFTNNVSKKYLRNTIGRILYQSPNVFIDYNNKIRSLTNPIVIFVDGKKKYYREISFENHKELFNKINLFLNETYY